MKTGKKIPTTGKSILGNVKTLTSGDALSKKMNLHHTIGPVIKVNLGFLQPVYVADAEIAQAVMQTQQKTFTKGKSYKYLQKLLGVGLLNAEGEAWKKQRKLAQPAFHKQYLETIYALKLEQINKRIQKMKDLSEKGESVRMELEMTGMALDVVVNTLLGSSFKTDIDRFNHAMEQALGHLNKRLLNPVYNLFRHVSGSEREFKRHRNFIDQQVMPIVEERKQTKAQHFDLLAMLMNARDEETGEPMSTQQLRDEIVTMFLAGHETTANAMTWAMYSLSQHPDVLKKVREETEQVLGDRVPAFEDIMKLPYLKQVIDEAMRMYPPIVMVGRENTEAIEMGGYHFEKGTTVIINIYGIHHNEAYWPEPGKFDPERFAPEKVKARSKFHFLPFAAGPRMCIGNHFAYVEMIAALALMVRTFDFKFEGEDLKPVAALTLRQDRPVNFKMKIREKKNVLQENE